MSNFDFKGSGEAAIEGDWIVMKGGSSTASRGR